MLLYIGESTGEWSPRVALDTLSANFLIDTVITCVELLWKSTIEWHFRSSKPFSALHCVSYFGIAEVALDLIRTKRWDVNEPDSAGITPLMWAARYGREEVVKLLLRQKHTQPDLLDIHYCRTALSWAAGWGAVRR